MKTLKELKEGLEILEEGSNNNSKLIEDIHIYQDSDDNIVLYINVKSPPKVFVGRVISFEEEESIDRQKYKEYLQENKTAKNNTDAELKILGDAISTIIEAQVLKHVKDTDAIKQKYFG